MKKDFISIKDLKNQEIERIFSLTDRLKKAKGAYKSLLAGKVLAMIFQKPSNRTRVSFEVGMFQLGGYSIYLGPDEINLGVRESIKDVAKTLSRYVDAIVIRTFAHKNILEMARYATVPVINGLSDMLHPCQALADVYTIKEKFKKLRGIKFTYVGDGNNVCNSLLYACAKVGIDMNIATPKGYAPSSQVVKEAKTMAKKTKTEINLFNHAEEAAYNADVLYTDVWASMGQEKEAKKRNNLFRGFQLNKKLLSKAKRGCLVMHCLPAHRGQEITDEVIDSRNSIVFDQAENRLHVQKAILIKLIRG